MKIEALKPNDSKGIEEMSRLATAIMREHYDPIIGKEQNDYQLERFQSVLAIKNQIRDGYRYYFVKDGETYIGFLAFYPRNDALYLSKYYVVKDRRGKGIGKQMLSFLVKQAKAMSLKAIELNVNRRNPTVEIYKALGFSIIREEDNEIGHGFIMDDYVFRLEVR